MVVPRYRSPAHWRQEDNELGFPARGTGAVYDILNHLDAELISIRELHAYPGHWCSTR
jgi:hypothetical protein